VSAPAPRVRRADLDDWSAAQALFREGDDFHADIAPGYFRSGARPEAEWRQLLEDGCAVAFVAEVPGDGAVGLVTVRIYDTPNNPTMVPRRRGHVETLVVAARHRRQGIGRRLLGEAVAWARVHGAVEMVLTIWSGNGEAEAFYERLGYRVLSRVLHAPLDAKPR
jgi:ribosomal protein S18 acetylase RimI-like enzyme